MTQYRGDCNGLQSLLGWTILVVAILAVVAVVGVIAEITLAIEHWLTLVVT